MSKNILVMGLIDPSGNPRPRRLIGLLKKSGYNVHVASFPLGGPLDIDGFYEIPRPSTKLSMKIVRKIIRVLNAFLPFRAVDVVLENLRWQCSSLRKKTNHVHFEAVVVEDLYLLPFAIDTFGGHKVVFDAREYYPGEFEENLLWRLIEKPTRVRMCRQSLSKCRAVMTVSHGLVEEYRSNFGIHPVLVRSVPSYHALPVNPVNAEKIRLVHHGVANRDRRLENIIDIFSLLDDRFELDFYLGGNESYRNELMAYASKYHKIRFMPPVSFEEIIPTLHSYDIGVCYFEPVTFNLKHCLPNKLFEFIQARLAVVSGPSPDITQVIHEYKCGVVAKNFDARSMADILNSMSYGDIEQMKAESHNAAKELSYEIEGLKILEILSRDFSSRLQAA